MPKLSIYVQEELLERARAVDPTPNLSQLIQRALGRLIAEDQPDDRPLYTRPWQEWAKAAVEAAATPLMAAAREEYEKGFRGALDFSEDLPWAVFDQLAKARFDIVRWISPWGDLWIDVETGKAPEDFSVPRWLEKATNYLGDLAYPAHPVPGGNSFTPTDAYLSGFGDALRALWQHVHGTAAGQEDVAAGWRRVLESLPAKVRAYYREAKPERDGATLRLWFPYAFHYQKAAEHLTEVGTLVFGWLGNETVLRLHDPNGESICAAPPGDAADESARVKHVDPDDTLV